MLQLSLFGKPQILLNDVQVTDFESTKVQALLYYLAVTAQPHSREKLATLLWGDLPETTAKRNLTKALTNLRRLLTPYILIERHSVALDQTLPSVVDVTQFHVSLNSELNPSPKDSTQNLTLLQQATDLYQGDFLEGFHVKKALEFEDWMLTQRERLREMMLDTLQRLTEHHAQAKTELQTALDYAHRLLSIEPWHETTHRQLMLLLARSGRREAALTQYETCCQILAEELGVEPMAETIALYERLKAANQAPVYNLPTPPNAFVGREIELQQIERYLADPACRLVTITGLGGMGKTRLALATAHQINQSATQFFLNGVAFISLSGVLEEEAVPLAIATALDVPLSRATSPRQVLLNFLSNQEFLLVLDNFEQVTQAVEFLLELLQQCPLVKLLVTSREPLNVTTEWRVDLEGLPIPPDEVNEVEALQNYASVAFFVRSASQVNSQFSLSEENMVAVGHLCRLVAGMPLALQLAATWLRMMSVNAILTALERDLDILATEMHDLPPRQRSMRAVFESTWQLLESDEQRVVETLSICRGGFTYEAAAEIAQATPFLLRRIIDRAFIYQQEELRYTIHPLTQQFAQEQLNKVDHEVTATTAHGQYYLSWLTSLEPALYSLTPQAAIKAIKQELDNLQQAWTWAIHTKQTEKLLHSLPGLKAFYDSVGLLQAGEVLIENTLAQQWETSDQAEALLLCQLLLAKAQFIIDQGRYESGAEAVVQALELAQVLQDEETIADAHDLRARILNDTGVYDEAKQQYEHALTTYRRLAIDRKTAKMLTDLGWTHIMDDEVDQAVPILEEALALERKGEHKRGIAFALGNLGVAYAIKGDLQHAMVNQQEALTAYEELGDVLNVERCENNLGMSLLGIGRYEAALPHMQRAVELARQLGVLPGLTNALDSLGTAYLACGRYSQAKVCLEEALDLALDIGYMYMNYSVRAILVRLFNRVGDLTQAQQQLQELRFLAEAVENRVYIARALAEEAQLIYLQNDLPRATEVAGQALSVLRETPAPLDLPFFLLQYAAFLRDQDPAESLTLTQEALAVAQNLQHKPLQMHSNALVADLSLQLTDAPTAHIYAETAHQLLSQLESYPDILAGMLHLSRYHLALDDREEAARLVTLVADHPASPSAVRRQAKTLLKEITGSSDTIPND